jgi:hypothetical protein
MQGRKGRNGASQASQARYFDLSGKTEHAWQSPGAGRFGRQKPR